MPTSHYSFEELKRYLRIAGRAAKLKAPAFKLEIHREHESSIEISNWGVWISRVDYRGRLPRRWTVETLLGKELFTAWLTVHDDEIARRVVLAIVGQNIDYAVENDL